MLQRWVRWDRWAARTVLDVLRTSGGTPGPALAAFQHACEGEITWLRRIEAASEAPPPLWGPASLAQMEAWMPEIEARLARVAAGLDEAGLQRPVSYTNSRGAAFTSSVEECLLHMLLH